MGQNVLLPIVTSLLLATPTPTANTLPYTNTVHVAFTQPASYTVQRGDTLGLIAQKVYGESKYWTILWQDNQWIDNPNVIYTNWHLTLRKPAPGTDMETDLPVNLQTKMVTIEHNNVPRQQIASLSVNLNQKTATNDAIPTPIPSTVPVVDNHPTPSNTPPAENDSDVPFLGVYQAAAAKYDVPWQILYGIHMTETGGRGSSTIVNHEGSGATGPMQFMPGTWHSYGVDGDGDGTADITDVNDAIYGAANFLQKHGSVMAGLHSYGGNTSGTLRYAYAKGLNPASLQ